MKLTVSILISMLMQVVACVGYAQSDSTQRSRLILVHYMPWYQAKPTSSSWGWHWSMDKFDPDQQVDGKRDIASHLYPLIGPYDSADPDVLEYHLLLMKLAGIDGVIVDWYGLQDFNDYRLLHHHAQELVSAASRLGLRVAVCYEDQTITHLSNAGKLNEADQVQHAVSEIEWLKDNWFGLDSYVRLNGLPVLLSFGQQGLDNAQWARCLKLLNGRVAYFSQQQRKGATGGFDWPLPAKGLASHSEFIREIGRSQSKDHAIPVAFPRFLDIYAEAGVRESWGRIPDEQGATFRRTLDQALESGASLIQIATWNDWGEGTVVEPSREFGYRDLEYIQQRRRAVLDPSFEHQAEDLRLPIRLYQLRSGQAETTAERRARLDQVAKWIADGKTRLAHSELEALENGN